MHRTNTKDIMYSLCIYNPDYAWYVRIDLIYYAQVYILSFLVYYNTGIFTGQGNDSHINIFI
jgi:hypothetical protein